MKIKLRILILSALFFTFSFCLIIVGCNLFSENGELKTTLSEPVVYRVGDIFSWNEITGANKYIVSFDGGENYISDTVCRVKDIEKGGVLSIKAVNMTADGKIKEQSETVEINLEEISESSAKYRRYELSDSDITIPAQVEKAVIVGDGEYHYGDIFIDTRIKPLIVELYDVNCFYFGLKYDDKADANQCVIVRSFGEEGSYFRGTSGSTGSTGATGGGLLGSGGKGGNGTNGSIAGKFNYVIFEGDKPLTFRGGSGGTGGFGGVANGWNTPGGDGGNGGSGGTGLSATNAYVALEGTELICAGGAGGEGGEGGYGKWMDDGDKGLKGSNGSDFVGNKTDVTAYFVIEKSAPASDNNGDYDNGPSANIIGTYKFYSATQDGETFYVGDEINGTEIDSDFAIFVLNDNGTCNAMVTLPDGEIESTVLTWERFENAVFFTDENENITRATISGDTLSYTLNGITITLKEEK